jgi:hypothetical protein
MLGRPEDRSETGFTLSEGTLDLWIQQFMRLRETQRWLARFCRRSMWLSWRGSAIFLDDSAANLAGIVVA